MHRCLSHGFSKLAALHCCGNKYSIQHRCNVTLSSLRVLQIHFLVSSHYSVLWKEIFRTHKRYNAGLAFHTDDCLVVCKFILEYVCVCVCVQLVAQGDSHQLKGWTAINFRTNRLWPLNEPQSLSHWHFKHSSVTSPVDSLYHCRKTISQLLPASRSKHNLHFVLEVLGFESGPGNRLSWCN